MGLESAGRASQVLELLFSLERSSKFSWLIIGMNNGSNENSVVLKYVNVKNVRKIVRASQIVRLIIPIKRSSKWIVVVKTVVVVLKCVDVKKGQKKY